MKNLIIASNNQDKINEIKDILGNKFNLISMKDYGIVADIKEDGSTFEENALIKAKYIHSITGQACLADDSGLSVSALNGYPGVFSARFSDLEFINNKPVLRGNTHDDEANNKKLLLSLKNKKDRSAKYVCAIALIDGNKTFISRGECTGYILSSPMGKNGFGYDPYFFSDEINMCFGLATKEAKNSISHRAKALHDLVEKLNND